MKDIIITSRRLKKEIYILSTCFIIAFLINIFSIITFKTPWYEIFTQIGYVLVITLISYLLVAIVRVIAILIKKMITRFA
jgi:glucan phosphoethanolaminetransferase (alkaline phosphatase superfamily)